MKKNILSRLLATSLTLALLLPCLSFAPAKADGWAIEMWHWEFGPSTTEAAMQSHIATLPSNIINETGVRSNGHQMQHFNEVYTEDGPRSVPTNAFSFVTKSNVQNGKHAGLPYVTTDGKVTPAETLEFELGGIENMYTRGLDAMNIDFTVFSFDNNINGVIPFNRRMEVYVSLDGETWLPDSVGIRSATLLGGGSVYNAAPTGLIYEVQTENLFDIEGFEPGDVLQGIKILPEGKVAQHDSNAGFCDITVNGYETRQDWETSVPEENIPTVTIDPDVLRQIAIDEGVRVATIPWTTDTTIDLSAAKGSSVGATEYDVRRYVPGIQYRGPVYSRNIDGTREQLFASIVDGKHTSGFINDTAIGMDCQTFGYNMLSHVVARYNAWACAYMPTAAGLHIPGNLKVSEHVPVYTDAHIIDLNTEQEVYEHYALVKGGDVLDTYCVNTQNGNHVRPVRDVVVVRNADGTVNGDKSYMVCVESTGSIKYQIQKPDGSVYSLSANDPAKLYDQLALYPTHKVLYGDSAPSASQYSFSNLYAGHYVGFSPNVYEDGVVELADVEMIFAPKAANTPIEKAGFHLVAASNYPIIDRTVKLEDRSTGEVLFEDFAFTNQAEAQPNRIHFNYENKELNDLMSGLSNGSYRLSVTISSGPLTAIGQVDIPETTKTYDFTITDKAPSTTVSLSAPNSVSKGETVQVLVKADGAFDAADVEVKFDAEQLTFVDGTLTPANAFGQVSTNKGVVQILAVDAGVTGAEQLAVLNFTAKSDVANLSKAVQLKSAQLVTADAAISGVGNKAVDATDVCPSVNFADVAQSAWYHDAVDYALKNNIMSGYGDGSFGPNDNLSRAMVVQVLYNKEGQPTLTGSHKFPDVKASEWFNNAVTWANQNEVVDGYGDGTFQPNKNVSLEEVAVILWNYSGNPTPTGDASSLGAHSDWAADALSWAAANGIFKNVPFDAVTGPATRAHTAQMLMNYLSK